MDTITSAFALLDVKRNRNKLRQIFDVEPSARIPIVVRGYITGVWGSDDGISQEFQIEDIDLTCDLADRR